MIIENIETQKIANRLMNILGKNINIMNKNGTIIASGDKSRIGDFHGAARDVIEQKIEVVVNANNEVKYEGSKHGVNLPIYYKNEVLGVVGITGEPSEVKGYGLIVKELVEIMIQEEERRNFELFQSRAVKNFARELIKYHGEEDYRVLASRAKFIPFDAQIPRVLIAVDICRFGDIAASYKEDSEVMIQRLKQQVTDVIYSVSYATLDVVANIADDHFVIFKSNFAKLEDYINEIEEALNEKLGIKVHIGIGRVCTCLKDYHNAYLAACDTITIGKRLHPGKLIYHCRDYKLQLLLNNVSSDQKQQFLQSLGTMFDGRDDEPTQELLKTVKVYFENKMSIKDTASTMFVHRNTILYRINRFIEKYGVDITDPYQCMMVYIGFNLMD